MNFFWTAEQLDFKELAIEFARTELNDDIVERDRESRFPRESWQKCVEFGIQSFGVPSKFSGRKEVDFLTAMLIMEDLGYGCQDNGLTFALNAQIWTVQLPKQSRCHSDSRRQRISDRGRCGTGLARFNRWRHNMLVRLIFSVILLHSCWDYKRNDSLTYAELVQKANGLAHILIEQGVKHGDRVGVYLHKSVESAIAIWGIMVAGVAYVPLDPSAPVSRLA